MSENNENKLEFDILAGNNTLTKELQNILDISGKIKTALGEGLSGGQNVTLVELKSIKTYLQEIHELSRIKVTLETAGKVPTGADYGQLRSVIAELKALQTQMGLQSQLSKQGVNELQVKAFAGKVNSKSFDFSDAEQRKAVKAGLEQRQAVTQLNRRQLDVLRQINKLDEEQLAGKKQAAQVAKINSRADRLTLAGKDDAPKTAIELKRSKELNVFQKARQGQLSPKDLQDFIAKGSQDPKRLVRELGAIQKQSRSAELDPNVLALHGNRPSLIGGTIGIELSRLTQTIKEIGKADKEDRKKAASQQKIADNELLTRREKARTGRIQTADIRSEKNTDILKAYGQGFKVSAYDNKLSPSQKTEALAMQRAVEERLKTLAAKAPKPLDWVGETKRLIREDTNAAGQLNPNARPALRTKAERAFDTTLRAEAHNKDLLAHRASLTTATISNLANAKEISHATQAVKLHSKTYPEQAAANQALLDAIKARTKALVHAEKMRDPNFAAAERLKQEQANLRTSSVDSRSKGQVLADERAQAKVNAELEKRQAIFNGIYNTEAKLKALQPEQIKHARDTLNYQYQTAGHDVARREEAAKLLSLLDQIHGKGKASLGTNTLISDLEKTHYKTKESLRNLGREELQQAVEVLKYRRQIATTEQERKAAQGLLNNANQNLKLHPENQAEHRQGNRERVLGDAGASLLTIQAGLMLNYKLLGGFQSLFGSAISSAIELDSAFRQLQAISAATNYEMAAMKVNLIDVAQASKFSSAEVGNTAVLLAQAGLSIQEIGASMKGIITLAQATGTDLGKSVDVVTSVLSVFNKSAGETNQVVNQLTQALNSSKLDIQKVALGIQYAGNISADAGVTFEELTSALGAMANAGIRSGSTLGTGFRQMLLDLERPSTKLKDRLDKLGLSLNQIDFRAYGLAGVLKNLREAGFTTADAFKTFEVRSAAAFSALSGNLQDFDDLQEELLETNAAFEANHVQLEALAVQLDHLKSNLGIVAAEGLRPMVALTRDVAKGLAHMMENAEEGSSALQVVGTALAGITAAVAIGWLAKLGHQFFVMTKEAALLRGAFLGLTPAGLIGVVAGVGLVTAAAVSHSNELKRLTTELDTAKGKYNTLKESLASSKNDYENIEQAIKKVIDRYGVLSASQDATTSEAKSLQKQFEALGLTFDNLANVKAENLITKLRELQAVQAVKLNTDAWEAYAAKLKLLDASSAEARQYLNTRSSKRFLNETLIGVSDKKLATSVGGATVATPTLFESREKIQAIDKLSPTLAEAIKKIGEFTREAASTGQTPKRSDFILARERAVIEEELSKLHNTISFEQRRFVKSLVDDSEQILNRVAVLTDDSETRIKGGKKVREEEKLRNYLVAQSQDSRTNLGGASRTMERYNTNVAKVTKLYDGDERKVQIGHLAEKAEVSLAASAEFVGEQLDEIPDNGSEEQKSRKNELQQELNRILEMQGSLETALKEMNEIFDKGNKAYLEMLTDLRRMELEEVDKFYKKVLDDYKEVDFERLEPLVFDELQTSFNKRQAAERTLFEVTNKNNAVLMESFRRKQETESEQFDKMVEEQRDKIASATRLAVQAEDTFKKERDLKDYQAQQDEFIDTLKQNDRLWNKLQESEAALYKQQTGKTLSSSTMFKDINGSLKKRAQVIANRTGISQEYAQYGTGAGGFFAKQAAKSRYEANKSVRTQQKLANSLILEDSLNPKIEEEKVKVAEYKDKIKATELEISNLLTENVSPARPREQIAEDLRLKKEQLGMLDRYLAAHDKSLNEMVKMRDDAKASSAESVQLLKEQVFDPAEEMMHSLRAGQEAMSAGLSSFIGDWASGMIQNTEDVKDAFEAMGKSILQSMLKVLTDRTATMFTDMLFGKADGSTGLGMLGNLGLSLFGGKSDGAMSFGMSNGGMVKGYSGGGYVSGTGIGRDSVPAMLMPNEYVLRPSATSALGKPFLDRLNATTTGSLKQLEGKGQAPQINVVQSPPTNVYVVSPDQANQMGANDVVVVIEDNISRNGSIKQLIKQVVSGEA